MPPRLVEVPLGTVLTIPLFVTDQPSLTRFRKAAFDGRGADFAFCRVLDDRAGAGYVVEVFDHRDRLDADLATVVSAPRLFDPVASSLLAVHKKRWRPLGVTPNYDPERHSRLSDVRLVLGAGDDLRLWHGGTGHEVPIDAEAARAYEPWTIWDAVRLEERILAALTRR